MTKKTIVFLLSREFGNATYTDHIEQAIKRLEYIHPVIYYFDRDLFLVDGKKINPLIRWILPFRGSFILKTKYLHTFPEKIDGLFFFSFEFPVSFRKLITRYPSVLAFDGTLIGSYRLKLRCFPGLLSRIEFILKNMVTFPFLYSMAKKITHFMPLTTWGKNSLVNDFSIPEKRISVATGGYDVNVWKPVPSKTTCTAPAQLLFIGNDFRRKGGDFLVSLFSRYIYPKATLKLISNDPYLQNRTLPQGCILVQGIGNFVDLVHHYQSADIFLLPTRLEWMGHVLIEAALTGLPLIASDSGGVSEIVRDGVNGFLMPYNATEQEWAEKILLLMNDREKYCAFRNAGLELAEKYFSREAFVHTLDAVFKNIFTDLQ